MDKKYITLFKELAQATAATAETVMEYDSEQKDEKGLEAATVMRDDFQKLADNISSDDYMLTKNDAAKLLVAAMITANQLQIKVNNLKKAISGYQDELIPVLKEIVDTAENDEMARQIADEKFIIKENK